MWEVSLPPPPPPPWQPCFSTDQNFTNNFRKGSPKEQFCEIISKSDKQFQRRRILKNFSEVNTVNKPPPPSPHTHPRQVFRRIKISRTNFEKGHTRNNLVKLFQILTSGLEEEDFLRISSCPYRAKSPPPSPLQPCFYDRSKISQTIFEKGHPRNNPVKLFQNLTSGFRGEEFWRISLKCTQWKMPLPTHMAATFFDGSKFCEQFFKRVTQGILWIYLKIGPAVSEEKIFKEFLKKIHLVAMATKVFDGVKFCD